MSLFYFRYTATRVFAHIINKFHGVNQMRLTNMLIRKKYSDSNWNELCALEDYATKEKKNIEVFIKATFHYIVDENTRKIKSVMIRSYLSSFRVV